MGQRANLIIVENKQYTVYYDHWAAAALDSYLFWGEQPAITFFRDHEKFGGEWWLNSLWCEGGAVIDLDHKVLLFFGGEDLNYEIPLRQLYFQLLAYLWPGYELRWAHQGIIDLAAYVGYDITNVMSTDPIKPPSAQELQDAIFRDCSKDVQGVLSIKQQNQMNLYPLYGFVDASELLLTGKELINMAAQHLGRQTYQYPDLSKTDYIDFAENGIHLDIDQKQLWYWMAKTRDIPESFIRPFWKGWEISCLGDNYKAHELLTQNKLSFPSLEEAIMLKQICNIVCHPYHRGDEFANELFAKLAAAGNQLEINHAIYATNLFDLSVNDRQEIFEQVVTQRKKDLISRNRS